MADTIQKVEPEEIVRELRAYMEHPSDITKNNMIYTLMKPGVLFYIPCFRSKGNKESRLAPVVLKTRDDKTVFPFYTSRNEMMKNPFFDINSPVLTVTVPIAAELLEQPGSPEIISINPYGMNFSVKADLMFSLRDAIQTRDSRVAEAVKAGQTPKHAEIRSLKPEVLEKIAATAVPVLKEYPGMKKAWAHIGETENMADHTKEIQLFLTVDADAMTADELKALQDRFSVILKPDLTRMDSLVVVRSDHPTGKQLAESSLPFYTAE